MIKQPFFSIVIPLYKKPDTIVKTLQSCLEQEYEDFEVIVVDDGSPDNSVERAKTVVDSRIRTISQKNAGVSAARNRGVEESKGEWILCLDADDELLPTALRHFSEAIRVYPGLDAYFGNTWWSHKERPANPSHIDTVKAWGYEQYAFNQVIPNAGNIIIKRDLLYRLKYDVRMSFYEDQDLYLRVMEHTRLGHFQAFTYLHRIDTADLSTSHHPIEKEAAYYFAERKMKSLAQQMSYYKIMGLCLWARQLDNDADGLKFYEDLAKRQFSYPCRLIYAIRQRMMKWLKK